MRHSGSHTWDELVAEFKRQKAARTAREPGKLPEAFENLLKHGAMSKLRHAIREAIKAGANVDEVVDLFKDELCREVMES